MFPITKLGEGINPIQGVPCLSTRNLENLVPISSFSTNVIKPTKF